MSEELRAAANEIIAAWESRPREYEPTTKFIAAKWLADAYLAEHPADDKDLVMPEWLESLGYQDSIGMRYEKRYEICSGIRIMFFAREYPHRWACEIWIGGGKCHVKSNPTCGDVRRLIGAIKN